MTEPFLDRFDEFFAAVHDGHDPFPWQRRLARRVAVGDWPLALALPTASGKTACIDIAVFALACQAIWPKERPHTAPRRIFFTVDRRVIVDEAFEHALNVARKLDEAEHGILRDVAQRLRELMPSGDAEKPLACFQLRGGVYRDDAWARTPT
jgi:CRISPR-associated endonuclease/helicase Cas3